MTDTTRILGVFAKFWQPGRVKTRLAASVGQEQAAELHRLFVATLVRRLRGLDCHRTLVYTPRSRRAQFAAAAGPGWTLQAQGAGDLGARMRQFFETAFAGGAERVVLLGSDSPSLPLRRVADAFAQLDRVPVVLGPSQDGGYYLIGISASAPAVPIFDAVAWGTGRVRRQTVDRLRSVDVDFHELAPWYDIDRLADLQRLHDELSQESEPDAALAALRPRIAAVVRPPPHQSAGSAGRTCP